MTGPDQFKPNEYCKALTDWAENLEKVWDDPFERIRSCDTIIEICHRIKIELPRPPVEKVRGDE